MDVWCRHISYKTVFHSASEHAIFIHKIGFWGGALQLPPPNERRKPLPHPPRSAPTAPQPRSSVGRRSKNPNNRHRASPLPVVDCCTDEVLCVDSSRLCMSGLSLCDLCLCYSIFGSQFSNKYLLT